MIKRRDWAHMHGQQGAESSDDESSDGSEVSQASTSSVTGGSSHSASVAGSDATSAASSEEFNEGEDSRRLQDLSEDDFESDSEPEVDITEQYRGWLQAPASQQLKGHALRCRFCPDSLLLNSTALKQHLQSKRHKNLQPHDDEAIPVCLAGGGHDEASQEEEGETHAERLARLRQQPAANAKLTNSQKRRQKRKAKAQGKQSQTAQKPGKRQRAELKAQIFMQAGSKQAIQDAKAARRQPVKPSS